MSDWRKMADERPPLWVEFVGFWGDKSGAWASVCKLTKWLDEDLIGCEYGEDDWFEDENDWPPYWMPLPQGSDQ